MFKIQLWQDNRLLEEDLVDTSNSAMSAVDAHLTEVHAGKRGDGTFRVEVDATDQSGTLYQGRHYASGPIMPRAVHAAA